MTPDTNLPKAFTPPPAKTPIANPGDRTSFQSNRPATTPAAGTSAPVNPNATRPPMATVAKPILPVAVPAPAKMTKGDASTCDSSASKHHDETGHDQSEGCCGGTSGGSPASGKSRETPKHGPDSRPSK